MKKIILLITILLILPACQQEKFGATDNISKAKLEEKYNASAEIKNKYQLDGASLKRTVKDDPKDMVRVEIGDRDATEFIPNLKISRWDEVSFKIKPKLDGIATKDKTFSFENDKVKYKTPKIDYNFYESINNGYDFEIVLNEKPISNIIEIPIETNNLSFHYQAPLNEEIKIGEEGVVSCTETDCYDIDNKVIIHRPENAIKSYVALYNKAGDYSAMGGKNYGTSKAFQIYRPEAIDNEGNMVWCDLTIDVDENGNGNMFRIIPQEFLDKAIYPIRIGTDYEITAYFNAYNTGVAWSGTPANMVDSNMGSEASTETDNDLEELTGNSFSPIFTITDISKVEIRPQTRGNPLIGDIYIRPVFSGGDGTYINVEDNVWYDITNDTNAPDPWTTAAVQALDLDVLADWSGPGALYCGGVEIRITQSIPSFGYSSVGATSGSYAENTLRAMAYYTPAEAGTIDKLYSYMAATGGTASVRGMVYASSTISSVTWGSAVSVSTTAGWKELELNNVSITAISYLLGYWLGTEGTGFTLYWDAINGYHHNRDNTAYHATNDPPATLTIAAFSAPRLASIVATYTAGGGDTSTAAPDDDFHVYIEE